MARYVVLFNWTEQGIRNFGDSVNRAEAAGKMFESLGGSLVDIYWTMGQYDLVGVLGGNAPDPGAQPLAVVTSRLNLSDEPVRVQLCNVLAVLVETKGLHDMTVLSGISHRNYRPSEAKGTDQVVEP